MTLAAATAFIKKRKIIVSVGGYHGGVPTFANGSNTVDVPQHFPYAEYNDPNVVSAYLRKIKATLQRYHVHFDPRAPGALPHADDNRCKARHEC